MMSTCVKVRLQNTPVVTVKGMSHANRFDHGGFTRIRIGTGTRISSAGLGIDLGRAGWGSTRQRAKGIRSDNGSRGNRG
jgi:hypothetical protein